MVPKCLLLDQMVMMSMNILFRRDLTYPPSFVDSFDISSQELGARDVAFGDNGLKMFVVGVRGDDVNEYTLSTAFDVSTASFVDSFDISSQDDSPTGLTINDGTKMFVAGNSGNDINEYTLSTGFDVSPLLSLMVFQWPHKTQPLTD